MISVLLLYNEPILPVDHPDAEAEHSVLAVARGIQDILDEAGFKPKLFGLGRDPLALLKELETNRPDAVVNLFEGNPNWTETESYVAGLLEWKEIPFTGSPMAALTLCRAKHQANPMMRGAGLPTAPCLVVDRLPLPPSSLVFPVIAKLA